MSARIFKPARTPEQADAMVGRTIKALGNLPGRIAANLSLFEMGPLFTRHDVLIWQAWQRAAHRLYPDRFPAAKAWKPRRLKDRTWA